MTLVSSFVILSDCISERDMKMIQMYNCRRRQPECTVTICIVIIYDWYQSFVLISWRGTNVLI